MIYINSEQLLKVMSINISDLIVVFDFDRTITSNESKTSWGIIGEALNDNYKKDSNELYNLYRKIEIDSFIKNEQKNYFMNQWIEKQINLLEKYDLNEQNFSKVFSYINKIKFRNGFKELLEILNIEQVPVIVISAGIGNIVEQSFKYNSCNFDNINFFSNNLHFVNNKIFFKDDIINSINKNSIKLPKNLSEKINDKKTLLIFGDQISDLLAGKNFLTDRQISVGFLSSDTNNSLNEYMNNFDIVCTENESYTRISKILIKKF